MVKYVFQRTLTSMIAIFAIYQSSSLASAAPIEVHFGVIQSLTGPAEEDGQTMLRALELARDQINREGRVHVTLSVEDDATSPKNSVTAFERLKLKGVAAIVGPSWSFLARTLAPVAARSGVVLFNTSNAPEVLNYSEGGGFLFSNSFTISSAAEPLRTYLKKAPQKRIGFVRTDNAWSQAHRTKFAEVASAAKLEIVEDLATVTISNNDSQDWIPRLKAKQVELVLLLLSRDDSEVFLRRAKELNYRPAVFSGPHIFDSIIRTKSRSLYEGVCLSYPYKQLKTSSEFIEAFKARFRDEPRIYADTTYDGLWILARAFEAAHRAGRGIEEELRELAYHGIAGNYRYAEATSFSTGVNDLVCVRDGKLVVEN